MPAASSRTDISRYPGEPVQPIQTLQGALVDLVLHSLGQVGEALQTRFNLMDRLFVGRQRLFDSCQDCSKGYTTPVAWIVGEVLTVPFLHFLSGGDERVQLVVP